ncbi:S1C family serine protease [Nocardioides acrostichi]|uniref:Trypsin-like peptidase domain-containing protein n=1 Tax=Nocardioides acrostichi TaxID=2784339 RepID=A0A930V5A8_9ACTN|nr:trypsin-like peptidase domain-containing protein [Nocardioides acrostichi]MBF4163444.1 trypsin-like peptidase domain-containing protein [Nocardioides acrostichi]
MTRTARRRSAVLAAGVLALPIALPAARAGAAPAHPPRAHSRVVQVDDRWSPPTDGGSGGFEGYGAYGGYRFGPSTTATTDTSEATTAESTGLVTITSDVDFGEATAAGTGMVVGADGLVVTNHHVVEGATSITVTVVNTGASYTAEVLGYDTRRDIAVLRLSDASGLTVAPLADTTDTTTALARGAVVTAVGDAGGDGGTLTASSGTLTALRRSITVSDEETGDAVRLRRLLEAEADIISGDSGGALLDAAGDVVGMNVAASSGSVDVTGYAIPIARVERVLAQVLAGDDSGSVTLGYTPFLGVALTGDGLEIAGVVADSGAADAGLARGDAITTVDGTQVGTGTQLSRLLDQHAVGDSVVVGWRDASGATHSAAVTLGRAPVA